MQNDPAPQSSSGNEPNSPRIVASPSQFTPEDLEGCLARLHDRKADEIFVIMNKSRTTVLKDPGLGRPFSTTLRKRAEQVQREAGGVVVTLGEAIKILITNQSSQ
jgi:hypothetical protein